MGNYLFLTIFTDKLVPDHLLPVLTVFLARLYSMLRSAGLWFWDLTGALTDSAMLMAIKLGGKKLWVR